MGPNKNKSSKSNEKLKGKGMGKGTSDKTPPTAETEAPQHSDEERKEEVMQVEVQEPRTQELHSETEDHEEEDLKNMKKVKVPDSLIAAQEQVVVKWFSEHPIFFN